MPHRTALTAGRSASTRMDGAMEITGCAVGLCQERQRGTRMVALMYPYHNKIKQRIRNGELIDWFYTDTYPRIGTALVLVFSTEPHRRPIRPHRWPEYLPLLKAAGGEEHGSIST